MKFKLEVGLLAGAVITIGVALMNYNPDYLSKIDNIQSKIEGVQAEINTLADERTQLRDEKIDVMAKYFELNIPLDVESVYPIDQKLDLENFLKSKLGMPYKLGAKGGGKLDCSGLLGTYAHYKLGIINHNTLINHYSAENIRQLNEHKNIQDITVGDLLYIIKNNKAVHIMYVYNIDGGRITTLEANALSGVSYQQYRFIKSSDGIFLEKNGKVRDFDITDNSMINLEFLGDFLISSYIPTSKGMNINNGGKSGRHTASGLPLEDKYAGKIVACPKQFSIGIGAEPKTKLLIEGYGIVECSDRGGLIVMKGELNSRGNISSNNRLDLFAGMDTAKIKRGQQHRNVYLIK